VRDRRHRTETATANVIAARRALLSGSGPCLRPPVIRGWIAMGGEKPLSIFVGEKRGRR